MGYSPIKQYKEQSVLSMGRGEQLVLLYDEAIKNLKYACVMAKQENFETFEKCTKKSKDIFQYLSSILDFKYPVSKELYDLYYFFNQEIIKAEICRKCDSIEPIIPIVEDLRNTWVKADKQIHMDR